MSLQDELGLENSIKNRAHEALLNVVLTGTLLVKEGDRVLRPFGLTDAQFNVLMLLKYQSDHGEMNQTSLGNMLLVNRSNVTGLIDRLEQASEDDSVKAIILYVDSPGGSVFASDEIALKIEEIEKPIIAGMGSLAASGGYYVSAPTDEIWASPHTLTCSIGVISQFLNVEEFAEEYGVTAITVKSGQFKDTGNPFREFTEADEALWQAIVDEAYAAFVEVVADGRGMNEEAVRALADGRVCSGQQAQGMGLVDSMGYLPDIIDRAAELGGIDGEPRIIEYRGRPGFFEALGATFDRPSPVEELQEMLHFHAGSPLMYLYVGP